MPETLCKRNMNRFTKSKLWTNIYSYLVKFIKVFSIPYILLITVCILYVKYISVNKLITREYSISSKKNVLILTAHPDDECMFFTPTILGLQEQGHRVFIVCLTKGNYYGEGERRKKELIQSCKQLGVNESHCTIIDDSKFPDHPSTHWNVEDLGETILKVTDRIKPQFIITYDQWGVSGHVNHKAIHYAVKKLYEDGTLPKDISVFTLESTNKLRKFISWFDIPWSTMVQRIPTVFVCNPGQLMTGWKAMACHDSQFVWFRMLYIAFSRYMVVNTLDEMTHRDVNNSRK